MGVTRDSLLGKYRLLSLIGTGGMAEVWKAKIEGPAGFEREVVVKRVLSHLARDPHFVEMFLAEARLSARLDHPNIVQVYELGQEGGDYFMAMEYVKGSDLGQLLRRGFRPPLAMSAAIMQAVGRALHHAHTLKDKDRSPLRLVHRDVSPSNIMIGSDGTIKLLDFGIAKAFAVPSERRTNTGTLRGKSGYMSPEQVKGETIDHRADIFAAGVVLHELITGQRLFKGASDFETQLMMLTKEIPRPSSLIPELPPALDEVCLRALARDPGERFHTASELADALEPFTEGWKGTQIHRALAPYFLALEAASNDQSRPITATAPALEDPAAKAALQSLPPVSTLRGRWARTFAWWLAGGTVTLLGGVAVGLLSRARPVESRPVESRPVESRGQAAVAPGPRPAPDVPPAQEQAGPPAAVVEPQAPAVPTVDSPSERDPAAATSAKRRAERRSDQRAEQKAAQRAERAQRVDPVGAGRKRPAVAPGRGPIDGLDLESARAPR